VEGVGTCWKRLSALLVVAFACGFGLAACGGGGGGEVAAPARSAHEQVHSNAAEAPNTDEEATPEPEARPKAELCDDGTCSRCGAGLCPSGWYCDESASGGPACGWLPECARKSSCGCLTTKLGAACKCSEQSGGLHLTCK